MPKKLNEAKPSEKLLSLYTRLLFDGREASLTQLSSALGCKAICYAPHRPTGSLKLWEIAPY
jgi:hypothetical protein